MNSTTSVDTDIVFVSSKDYINQAFIPLPILYNNKIQSEKGQHLYSTIFIQRERDRRDGTLPYNVRQIYTICTAYIQCKYINDISREKNSKQNRNILLTYFFRYFYIFQGLIPVTCKLHSGKTFYKISTNIFFNFDISIIVLHNTFLLA